MYTVRGQVVNQFTREPMTINGSEIPAQKFVQLLGFDAQGRSTVQDVAIPHNKDLTDYQGQEVELPVSVFASGGNGGRAKLKTVYNPQG